MTSIVITSSTLSETSPLPAFFCGTQITSY
jgi:hypothetical protein